MSTNITIFENVTIAGKNTIIPITNAKYLQLDVSGSMTSFEITPYAQVTEGGEYLPIAVIGNKDFKIYNSIKEKGFFQIDVTGVANIKIELTSISGGSINCKGILDSTIEEVKDYVDTAIADGSVQTVVVSGGTNNGTIKVTVDDVATDNITVTGWDTKADEVEVERIKYYGDPDIVPSDGSYFTVNSTGETITGLTDTGKTQAELVIPYKINGKEITKIGEHAFESNTVVQKIVVPSTISIYGGWAFIYCSSLTEVVVNNNVKLDDYAVFFGCTKLKQINFNKPNCYFYPTLSGSMSSCTSLKHIEIAPDCDGIADDSFRDCTSLTSINIPNSVTGIGSNAFTGCTSLTSVNIPNSVTSIWDSAFSGCTNLTIYCEQGSYADNYAKENNIPVVYTDINRDIIDELARLRYYGDPNIIPSNGSYFTVNSTGETITGLSDTGGTQTELVFPYMINGVKITSIGDNAFDYRTSLTSINIPNSVTSIGRSAFYDCTSLTSINIPSSVTSIGNNALDMEDYESGSTFPISGLTIYCEQGSYAETYAKENGFPVVYTDIKDIATETELERLQYYGDKDVVPSDESYFTVNETGETITGLTDTGKTQTEIVIPYKINGKEITTLYSGIGGTSILEGATDKIIKVILPNSITNIGTFAFWYCTSLTSINIPDSVTSIEVAAFINCTSLTSINIPNSVTSIGSSVFEECSSLKTINIPNSVTSIGDRAFYGCTSLNSIEIPNSVTSIGSDVFNNCTNLKIYCEQGSHAETYAKANNIPIVYIGVTDISGLPDYTSADEGKVLKIVNGVPTWVSITTAEEVSY